MASYQINHYLDTPFGQIHVFTDPAETRKAERLIKETPKILWNAWKDAAERYGSKIIKEARRCIAAEMPPKGASWPPLSQHYVDNMGGDDRIYYKTGQYYESIGVHKENMYYAGSGAFARPRYFVGLPNGVQKFAARYGTNRKPLTLQQVALILELGYPKRNIPARPLWRPLFEANGGKARIQTYVRNALRRQLSKYM